MRIKTRRLIRGLHKAHQKGANGNVIGVGYHDAIAKRGSATRSRVAAQLRLGRKKMGSKAHRSSLKQGKSGKKLFGT